MKKKKESGYIGRIKNTGAQIVEAPHLIKKKDTGVVRKENSAKGKNREA